MKSEKLSLPHFYEQLPKKTKLNLKNCLIRYLGQNGTSKENAVNSFFSKSGIAVVRLLCDLNRDIKASK
jgi:hypothetical protein